MYKSMRMAKVVVAAASAVLMLSGGVSVAQAQPCQANELAKLLASDGAGGDQFGNNVAICGDIAVIGAEFDDDNGTSSGSAYVFARNEGGPDNWGEVAKLLAFDGTADDRFGSAVACSGDTIVIGARLDDDNGVDSGSAYVFVEPTEGWGSIPSPIYGTIKLLASDGAAGDRFGMSAAISGDTIVVGANDDNGVDPGSAYVFVTPTGGWVNMIETAKLTASDGVAGDMFGGFAAISGDTVVVGAPHMENGTSAGSAYVFEKPVGGWVNMIETAKLTASDGAVDDLFGRVSISVDTIVVGAVEDDNENGTDAGSTYVFAKPVGDWVSMTETQKLIASDGGSNHLFGGAVSVCGDILVVGAHGSAVAYVFRFVDPSWVEQVKLVASDGPGAQFGAGVGISGDTAVIGARYVGGDRGAAYVFGGLSDCNEDDSLDICDIVNGASQDINGNGIPDECECWIPGDMNGDGLVNGEDIQLFIDKILNP